MENLYINDQLKKYSIKNLDDYLNAIREIAQKIILISLSKKRFFDFACFNGGTCLRLFYNIPRFSEDLDFDLAKPIKNFDFEIYAKSIIQYLLSYGIESDYRIVDLKNKTNTTDVYTCYIKIDLNKMLKNTSYSFTMPSTQKLTIKIDLATSLNKYAKYEYKTITRPSFASIRIYDKPTLFASKLHAILYRQYKNRVKGRDYFDYVFYVADNTPINIKYLTLKSGENFNLNELKEKLKIKFKIASINEIKSDLYRFVENDFDYSILEYKNLLSTLSNLKIEE